MADLVAEGIVKRFPDRTVLDGVFLRAPAGALTLVAGRSGSGKSTLFSILAGLEPPTAGRVLLGAEELTQLDAEARARLRVKSMGVVFQDFRLIPDLTAAENVRLPMNLAGRRKGSRQLAFDRLRDVDMMTHWDAFPETLSGGEQQRVAVARALANDPAVVLADEPTANLDEENAHRVLSLLRAAARAGRAVVVVSHDPLATSYADQAVRLQGGRIERMVAAQRPRPTPSP